LQTVDHPDCRLEPGFFTRRFVREVELRSPFRFWFLQQKEKTLAARGTKLIAALRQKAEAIFPANTRNVPARNPGLVHGLGSSISA
jgi:hypothetical protein